MTKQNSRDNQIVQINSATVSAVTIFTDREDRRLAELHIKVKISGQDLESVNKAIAAAREQGSCLGLNKDGDDIILPLTHGSRGYYIDAVAVRIPKSNRLAQIRKNDKVVMRIEFSPFRQINSRNKGIAATIKNAEVL